MIQIEQIKDPHTLCHDCRQSSHLGMKVHSSWNVLTLCRECAKDLFNEMQERLREWYK
jgi:hypothetical protein